MVDYSEIDEWAKKLEKSNKWKNTRKNIVNDLAARLIRLVKERTPVGNYPEGSGKVGGTLKKGWQIEAKETADAYEVTIFNNTKYAPYVEYGHRTKSNKGWVEGKFMLSKSEVDIAGIADDVIKKRLEAFLEELFND